MTDDAFRCPWATSAPDYLEYHDNEWGRRVDTDDEMFERLALEAFQSGLSWLVILRKREAFREAFAQFRVTEVAGYDEHDVERLLANSGIVRNRAKIEATIANARVATRLETGLAAHLWSFAPQMPGTPPQTIADVPSVSSESTAMAKDLKKRGFRFVGPTTAYALMQATGMVNDHLAGCVARSRL